MPEPPAGSLPVLLSRLSICLWRKNICTNRFDYLSEGTAALYGIEREVLYQNPDAWFEAVVEDDRSQLLAADQILSSEACELEQEYRILRAGEIRWIRDLKRSFLDENGYISSIEGLAEDITDKKRLQQQLKENEQRYRFYFDNNPRPMWIYDCTSLRFLNVNQAACALYGHTPEEFLALTILDIRPSSEHDRLKASVSRLTTGLNNSKNWTHLKKDGSSFQVEITGYVFEEAGRKKELIVVHDITELIQHTEKIESFAFMTSHRVRKPLANILGIIHLLHLDEDVDSIKQLAESLAAAGQELDEIIRETNRIIRGGHAPDITILPQMPE